MPFINQGEVKVMDDCEHRYSIQSSGKYVCELCNRVAGSLSNNDMNTLAFCSFRYGLGRMSYVVGNIVQALINNKYDIRSETKRKICSEILEAIDSGNAGMECDIAEWKRLMEEFKCIK